MPRPHPAYRWLAPAFALAVVLATTAQGAAAQQKVLIITGPLSSSNTDLVALHTAAGNQVTTNTTRPDDLSPYRQVWDLRYNSALSLADVTAYSGFLQSGGGMFLVGENTSAGAARNPTITSFINTLGGGVFAVTDATGAAQSQTVCSPFTGPNTVGTVTWRGAGAFSDHGTGQWISATSSCDNAVAGTGIAFGAGSLTNATAGTLTTVLDINFLDSSASTGEQQLAKNLVAYVGAQVAAQSTVPEPSTYALVGAGLLGVGGLARRRRGVTTA